MRKIDDNNEEVPLIDYSKEINVKITVAELMLIKATFGESNMMENVEVAERVYNLELGEVVSEFDVGQEVYKGALSILQGEGVE